VFNRYVFIGHVQSQHHSSTGFTVFNHGHGTCSKEHTLKCNWKLCSMCIFEHVQRVDWAHVGRGNPAYTTDSFLAGQSVTCAVTGRQPKGNLTWGICVYVTWTQSGYRSLQALGPLPPAWLTHCARSRPSGGSTACWGSAPNPR
jgi:hypothetical protein